MELPNPFKRASTPIGVDELLDIAFRRAFKKPRPVPRRGDKTSIYRSREISRVQTVSDTIISRLDKIVKSFPSIERLDPFYRELLEVLIDSDRMRHSLGAVKWASRTIFRISRLYIARMRRAEDPNRILALRREVLGRISSVLKRVGPELDFLRNAVPALKELPDIDLTMPTVIIAGMPNTGKSTLLSRLTTKEPEIAPYPFTTRGLVMGHRELKGLGRVQFVDTPGLLDRPLSERNRIEMQAVVALRHLGGLILFVMDPSETCGYTLGEQISLLREIRERFGERIVVVVNKTDLARDYGDRFSETRSFLRKEKLNFIEVSAERGYGIGDLIEVIRRELGRE